MKIESKIKSSFSPIEVKLTIESEIELEILYQLFNNHPKNINFITRKEDGGEFDEKEIKSTTGPIFQHLFDLRKETRLF